MGMLLTQRPSKAVFHWDIGNLARLDSLLILVLLFAKMHDLLRRASLHNLLFLI